MRRVSKIVALAAITLGVTWGTEALAGGGNPSGNQPAAVAPDSEPSALAITTDVVEADSVSVTPCRLADTRQAGGALARGTTRSFEVQGTTGFVPQGGKSGGCGVPEGATAAVISMSAVTPADPGFLRAWAFGTPPPTATLLNYGGSSATTTAVVPLAPFAQAKALTVGAFSGGTHVVLDVTGYQIPPIHAILAPEGGIHAGSSRVLSSAHPATGRYEVTVDRSVVGCSPTGTVHGGPYFVSVYESGNTVFATTYGFSNGTPTPFDLYWTLTVSC